MPMKWHLTKPTYSFLAVENEMNVVEFQFLPLHCKNFIEPMIITNDNECQMNRSAQSTYMLNSVFSCTFLITKMLTDFLF